MVTQKKASVKEKEAKKKSLSEGQMEQMLDDAVDVIEHIHSDEGVRKSITIHASKPITKIKKGDMMKIDGVDVEVDTHYVLMDHGSTKEMAIEVFDTNDKEYQIRYFDDQVEKTLEVYELQEIMYLKKLVKSIAW